MLFFFLICRNASLGLCQCEKGEWKTVQKGLWNFFMSPYEDRYVDVKFIGDISGSIAVSVEEGKPFSPHLSSIFCYTMYFIFDVYFGLSSFSADFQRWRLVFLALGFVLLLLAPVVSSWVPFYYSSSMAIGIFLVIIILLFQVFEQP